MDTSVRTITALLYRIKGRLSIGYEFKKLSLEKTKAIYPDAKEGMTLADAHNASVNNGYEEKKRKSIGFN